MPRTPIASPGRLILLAVTSVLLWELVSPTVTASTATHGEGGGAAVVAVRPGVVIVKVRGSAAHPDALLQQPEFRSLVGARPGAIRPFIPTSNTTELAKSSPELRYWTEEVARIHVVEFDGSENPWVVAARLARHPDVEYAEPWMLMEPLAAPDDSLYGQQAFLQTIKAAEAFDVTQGDPSVIIAVADTDVKWDHPDLADNIWINPGESGVDGSGRDKRSNGVDDDGNGMVDDWHGWDFAGPNNQTPDNDTRNPSGGHGTSVAGLAGASTNNRIGIASIGNRCRILPIKIGADGGGGLAFGYQAMDYASRLGARIFNASWGSLGYSRAGEDVVNLVTSRGMLVVGGAGNHGGSAPFYPASYAEVLNAGVTDAADVIQGASGFGPSVDVMAPGQGALTTNISNGYSGFGATSAASPIAAGVAALVAARFPAYAPSQIRERVRVTSDNIDAKNPTRTRFAGKGRVNAYRAVSDGPTPSIRIRLVSVTDDDGNGRYDVGERLRLIVEARNLLDATPGPVTLTLTAVQQAGAVQLVRNQTTIAAIAANGTLRNDDAPFELDVLASTLFDAHVLFRVDISSGDYDDFDFFSLVVNPSFKDFQSGRLSVAVQANGMLGFKDYPDNTHGSPLRLGAGDLQLYLGSLMLGISEGRIVDNVRSAASFLVRNDDFRILEPVRIIEPDRDRGARAAATSRFSDAGADSSRRLRVEVVHDMFDFTNLGVSEVLLSRYTIRNVGTEPLIGLRAGLFLDFGGYPQYYPATVAYDSLRRLATIVKTGFPTVGVFTVDSLPLTDSRRATVWAINNDPAVPGNPFGTLDGFTAAEKWRALSTYAGNRSTPQGNLAVVLTAPVLDIPAGESGTVVFGITASTVPATLRTAVDNATQLWRNPVTVSVESPIPASPDLRVTIAPQPARAGTPARATISGTGIGQVRLELFSAIGVRLWSVETGPVADRHIVAVPVDGLPAGNYLLRVHSGRGVTVAPVTVIR